jgi:hypothetical protein
MEPTGVAPASSACKADALLLSYGPGSMDPGGSAPPSPDCEPGALLVERWAPEWLVETAGIEPAPAQCHCAVIPFHYAPERRPPVLPRILLVFSQTCDSYTRAAERSKLPGLESNQRPPVSETGLRTGTECLAMKSGPHDVPHRWGPPCSLCSGPIVKGEPRTRGSPLLARSPGNPDGDRPRPTKKPRARFRGRGLQPFRRVVQVIRSPRTAVRSFSACAWKSTPAAFAALRVVPGAPMTEREPCRAAAADRGYLVLGFSSVTELFLLPASVALTRGSPKGSGIFAADF